MVEKSAKMKAVEYITFQAGYCSHPECVAVRGRSFKPAQFPAIFALIKHHIHGYILFDTGYSEHFFSSTKNWIYKIYSLMTPVSLKETETAKEQLAKLNINANDINYIIISHFHADHIAGIKDFKNAKFILKSEAYDNIKNKQSFNALIKGFLPGLVPDDFRSRLIFLEEKKQIELDSSMLPFEKAYDIFGDKSLLAIDLPGHARGQIGILIPSLDVFFVADAAWSLKAIKEYLLPSSITKLIFDDFNKYAETLQKLHKLIQSNKAITLIVSHCRSGLGKRSSDEIF